MQTAVGKRKWTDQQLLQLAREGQKSEVFGGELVMSPTGFQHGYISSRLLAALMDYALSHRLGVVVDSSTGFRLRNGDCLSPARIQAAGGGGADVFGLFGRIQEAVECEGIGGVPGDGQGFRASKHRIGQNGPEVRRCFGIEPAENPGGAGRTKLAQRGNGG